MQVFVTRGGYRSCSSIDLQLTLLRQGFLHGPGFHGCKTGLVFVDPLFSKHLLSLCAVSVWVLVLSIFIIESSSLPSFFQIC